MKLNINGFKIVECMFINKSESNTKIELSNGFSYNVKYAPDNTCLGELTINIKDKNSDKFNIKFIIEGLFGFKNAEKQEDIHKATFREIYAYARSTVTMFTANAGIPPISLPCIDIENQSIYKISDVEEENN